MKDGETAPLRSTPCREEARCPADPEGQAGVEAGWGWPGIAGHRLPAFLHEIRNPLQVLALSAALLGSASAEPPAPELLERLRVRILEATRRLERFLSLLVDIYAAVHHEIEVRPVALDLDPFLEELFEQVRATDGGQHEVVRKGPPGPSVARLDEGLLRRVLYEILLNACTFAGAGSTVSLRVEVSGDVIRFEIQDAGSGIPEGLAGKVFKPFERGTNAVDKPGAGLGLALVDRLVRLQCGRCELASEPRRGTSVLVELPLGRELPAGGVADAADGDREAGAADGNREAGAADATRLE